ncbi:MAG: histidine utilization repressor [Rhizobiaceae bacterium]|nr:histidine utilization repressor [Rhizobiaceae bacterium]
MNESAPIATAESEEATSLYQRILNDIRGKIVSGSWPPGHRIPFEHELTVQYGCSRMTVNKALSQLAKTGLIERRRRSGSFVRSPRSQAAVLEITDIRSEVEALGLPYRYKLADRELRRSVPEDKELLGPERPRRLLAMTCLHRAGSRPFCLEHRLISLSTVPEAADEPFDEIAPGPWLIDRVPWSTAEHRISAASADAETALALDIDEGASCLVIERRTWTADLPVTFARFIYPGESHSLVARFEPN